VCLLIQIKQIWHPKWPKKIQIMELEGKARGIYQELKNTEIRKGVGL